MSELIQQRTQRSKTFDLGGGKHRLHTGLRLLHYPDEQGDLQECDCTPRDAGAALVVDKAWYIAEASKSAVEVSYRSRTLGEATVRLTEIDDVPVDQLTLNIAPTIEGHSVWYRDLVPSLDIEIRFDAGKFEWFKYLRDASAPRSLMWEVERPNTNRSFEVHEFSKGWDSRPTQANNVDRRRWAHLDVRVRPLPGQRQGLEIREHFLDAVDDVEDSVTRQRVPKTNIKWPVTIDADVEEDIVADNDDGRQYLEDAWKGTDDYFYFNSFNGVAWRFQSVAIPQGATIDTATLTVTNSSTGAYGSTLYGEDVDSAGAWAHDAAQTGPADMDLTDASVEFSGFGSAAAHEFDVKTIVQEIVDRVGWSSGAHMRFGALEPVGTGIAFKSYDYSPANSGDLDVDYTEGGAAAPSGLVRIHGS